MPKKFTADFETNVDENDCRVWAWAVCEIGNPDNFKYGTTIEGFIRWCKEDNYTLYFHNLKFDGEYIFHYLLTNGYTLITDITERKDKTFETIISDMGQFYMITIYFKVNNRNIKKVTIYDSLKLLNFSVETIAKSFDLPIRKLELDYKTKRDIGHRLTKHEIDYIRCDVEVMSRALDIMFKEGLDRMTIGACALNYYRKSLDNFNRYFPDIPYEIDEDIRTSYRGGFTYLNPLYKEKETGEGLVLDVNSLYPSCMRNEILPFGQPIFFNGKYKYDMFYPLYVQRINVIFELKPGKIPTIQVKKNLMFQPNEFLESSKGDILTLTLTNIDLELFLENYNTIYIEYVGGWKFKGKKGLFKHYIDEWSDKKIQAKKDGNPALYLICKLMLNSLYGKFSKNPNIRSKVPILLDDYSIGYEMLPTEIGKGLYIPVGSFITSYARNKTIRTSQAIRDYTMDKYGKDFYIYSDTDSIHMLKLPEEELKKFIDIDDYRLGAWKLESTFRRGKYLRQKAYIEEDYSGELNVVVAGLPKKLGKYVNFENFNVGFSILASDETKEHKLTYKHVKGGVLLEDTDFTIQ